MLNTPAFERTIGGVRVPAFLYGTAWKEAETRRLVRLALRCGFRGIDTANQRKHYDEAAVGAGIADAVAAGEVSRADLFVQTKFTHLAGQDRRLPYDPRAEIAEQVRQSCASSLQHLGTDRLDSFVLHGPSLRHRLAPQDREAWAAMTELQQRGTVRLLGASNVTAAQVEELCALGTPPAFVQNRCFASTGWDAEVRELCRQRGIVYQAFSLLTANAAELASRTAREVAGRAGLSVPQVVFRFSLQVGMVPLTGTTSEAHMLADLAVLEHRGLDAEAMHRLETIASA